LNRGPSILRRIPSRKELQALAHARVERQKSLNSGANGVFGIARLAAVSHSRDGHSC